ncbi:MAG: DUF983 domain-containing protein [Aestuariivirga sp.]|uniref:DUF983 domain-containing protein n=1 Tax=Aestuariivirga sp. TaxID=2650926 RepID=UPI0025BBFA26|nr:DUF983 domain-containing protein [Aestuariivirga sp.]MCA3560794.1 DUF983 domain-containing protein [Aestuariivirga sp.]
MNDVYYPDLSPLRTGLAGACPRCGRGKLFDGYLTLAGKCQSCGLSYAFADGGDGAAWFVMLFVCFAGAGSILGVEAAYSPPYWVHALIAVPVLVILPMLLLRPVKGVLINQQWKTGAREGRLRK